MRPLFTTISEVPYRSEIDDSIILSMGYTLSNFDLYGGSRNIVIEGRKLNPERHPLMHSFFIGIGYRF